MCRKKGYNFQAKVSVPFVNRPRIKLKKGVLVYIIIEHLLVLIQAFVIALLCCHPPKMAALQYILQGKNWVEYPCDNDQYVCGLY